MIAVNEEETHRVGIHHNHFAWLQDPVRPVDHMEGNRADYCTWAEEGNSSGDTSNQSAEDNSEWGKPVVEVEDGLNGSNPMGMYWDRGFDGKGWEAAMRSAAGSPVMGEVSSWQAASGYMSARGTNGRLERKEETLGGKTRLAKGRLTLTMQPMQYVYWKLPYYLERLGYIGMRN